jgi:hypothetical protein
MPIKCRYCSAPVPDEKENCQACGRSNGAPNVRLAEARNETDALDARYQSAEVSAGARSCLAVLTDLGEAVSASKVVLTRDLATVKDLLDAGSTYTSYHRQVWSGSRMAKDNVWDRTRTQVDAALFPNFFQDILFGALTLNDRGVSGYGEYMMILREPMIAERTSLFEANAFDLVEKRKWLLTQPIPAGHRAAWRNRDRLAMVKLHPELHPNTGSADFPKLVLNDHGGTGDSDFIEAHIYGPINAYTVEKIVGPRPRTRDDRLLFKSLETQLGRVGAILEAC